MLKHEEKVKIIEFINKKKQDFSSVKELFEREINVENDFNNFDELYCLIGNQRDCIAYLYNISKNIKPGIFYEYDIVKPFRMPFRILNGSMKFSKINLNKLTKFELAFSVVSCITYHINKSNKTRYLYHFDSLLTRNVSDFLIFEKDYADFKKIKEAIKLLGNSFRANFLNFNNNYCQRHFASKKTFENLIKKIFLSEDGFHFYFKSPKKTLFFNEKIIYDCLSISINKDGTLCPLMSIGSSKFPHFDFPSENVLPKLINDFQNFEYCLATLELIKYLTCKENMSEKTVTLFIDKYEKGLKKFSSWKNESMLHLFCNLISDKKMTPKSFNEFKTRILPIVEKGRNIKNLIEISNAGMDVGKKNKKRIKKYNRQITLKMLKTDDTPEGLRDLLAFEYPKLTISLEKLNVVSKNFYEIIKKLKNGVEIAHLYCEFMSFLNKEQIFNFDTSLLEIERLKLFNSWDKKDYKKCINSLEKISIDGPKMNVKEAMDECNRQILSDPRNFGYITFAHDQMNFVKMLESGSETVFNKACQNIDISKPFPKVIKINLKNSFAKCIATEIQSYLNEFGYRMLNNYSPEEYLSDYYSDISHSISLSAALFTKEKELYNFIKNKFRKSKLLKWTDKPTYADLMQLFPLIESQILLNGKYNGISPLKYEPNSSVLKEPSTILLHRFRNAQKIYGDLEGVSDLIFVYVILYDSNLLNIRNKIVHGDEYPMNVDKLAYYRKLIVIALAIIVKRNETEKN